MARRPRATCLAVGCVVRSIFLISFCGGFNFFIQNDRIRRRTKDPSRGTENNNKRKEKSKSETRKRRDFRIGRSHLMTEDNPQKKCGVNSTQNSTQKNTNPNFPNTAHIPVEIPEVVHFAYCSHPCLTIPDAGYLWTRPRVYVFWEFGLGISGFLHTHLCNPCRMWPFQFVCRRFPHSVIFHLFTRRTSVDDCQKLWPFDVQCYIVIGLMWNFSFKKQIGNNLRETSRRYIQIEKIEQLDDRLSGRLKERKNKGMNKQLIDWLYECIVRMKERYTEALQRRFASKFVSNGLPWLPGGQLSWLIVVLSMEVCHTITTVFSKTFCTML